MKNFRPSFFLAAGTLAIASSAFASTVTWDSTAANGVVDTGAGTWNLSNTTWTGNAGTTNTAFTNGDDAVFTGDLTSPAAQTITLGSSVAAASLRADGTNGASTTINGATGFTFTLGTGVAGSGGLTDIAGTGAYGQNITLKAVAGEALFDLAAGSGTAGTTTNWNITGGKAFLIDGSNGTETARFNNNFVKISGTNNAVSSVKIQGVVVTNANFVVDSGILEFAGAGGRKITVDNTNTVVVNNGGTLMMDFNSSTGSAIALATTLNNGSTIRQGTGTSTGQSTTNSGTIAVNGSANVSNTATLANFTLSGIIADGTIAGGLNFTGTGTGTTTLSGMNTYTGGTTVTSGSLTIGSTGGIVVGNAGVNISSGATLAVNGKLTLNAANSTLINLGSVNFAGSGASIFAGNLFDGLGGNTYRLISGGTITNGTAVGIDLTGSTRWISASLDNSGLLTFNAVPEPGTYGLIGAGSLAAAAIVRRRRRSLGKVA